MSAAEVRRRAQPDLEACVGVLRAVHEHRGYPVNWPADPAGWLAGSPAWVAVIDGAVAGHVAVTRADGAALIERLFVEPALTGAGIGRTLLRHAVSEARMLSPTVYLDVVAADDAANGLYRSDGWTEVSRTPIAWGRDASARLVRYRAPDVASR